MKTTGMSAREYANQALFRPLGIPPVNEADWGGDLQGITTGGYGLHLRPADNELHLFDKESQKRLN